MKSLAIIPLVLALATAQSPDEPCETTLSLPTITLTQARPGGYYEQCYTVTYDRWYSGQLRPHAYTITESCKDLPCRAPEATAPPPSFTQAAVVCSTCGGDGAVTTATLTIPIESIHAYKEEGYEVEAPQPTGEDEKHVSEPPQEKPDYEHVVTAGSPTVFVNGVFLGLFGFLGALL